MTETSSHQLYRRDWSETNPSARGLSLSFSADGIRLHEYRHWHGPDDQGLESEYGLFLDGGQLRPMVACVAEAAGRPEPLPDNAEDLRSFLVDCFRSLAATGWSDAEELTDIVACWLAEAGVPYRQERPPGCVGHTIFADDFYRGFHQLSLNFPDGRITFRETYDYYSLGDDEGRDMEYWIEVDAVHLRRTAAYLRKLACLTPDGGRPGPLPDTVEGLCASLANSLRSLVAADRLRPASFLGSYRQIGRWLTEAGVPHENHFF
jgi:hypothetical protein